MPDSKARAEWLRAWADQHTDASVATAREAVKGHFGVSLGTTLINQIMKAAREKAGVAPARRGRPEGSTSQAVPSTVRLTALADELRSMGVKNIEVQGRCFGDDDDDFIAQVVVRGKGGV